jgi:FkbM family methyltransferase
VGAQRFVLETFSMPNNEANNHAYSRQITLVDIADMYIYYYTDDHAYKYALQDPRAKEISKVKIIQKWVFGDVNASDAWRLKGMGIFSLISLHYWNNDLKFSYIDIGANYGMTTIAQAIFYKRCGKMNGVYAFEPGEIFPLLKESVYINRVDNIVECIEAAASDQPGKVRFHNTPRQSPASSLLSAAVSRTGVEEVKTKEVNCVTIDDFVKTIPDTEGLLIKIDAEGADFKVVDGMNNCLKEKICCFQIELFPSLLETYANISEIINGLLKHFYVIDNGQFPGEIINNDMLLGYIVRVKETKLLSSDLLMIPKRLPSAEILVERIVNNFR